jgi:protein-disulfide isomerase
MTSNSSKTSAVASRPAGAGVRIGAIVAAPLLLLLGLGLLVFGRGDMGTSDSGMARAGEKTAGISGDQKGQIEAIVKEYLLTNPELLLEMQSALEAKMAKEEAAKTKVLVSENAKDLYRHPDAALAGNPDGDITVVEFFDYNCGYCKRGFGDVAKLIEEDKNIRFVFKEFPILREDSEDAARVALAAKMQGKYFEVHRELINSKGLVNEAAGLKAAEKHGLDMEKLKADMNSDEVTGEIERVKELAGKMGINGTPHFLVGDRAIGGAPQNLYELLRSNVAELRKSGCTYC